MSFGSRRRRVRPHGGARRCVNFVLLLAAAAWRQGAAQQPSEVQAAIARAAASNLRPGDRMIVTVLQETTIADTVDLDHDGSVVLPLVGRLRASGIAIRELEDSVEARYRTHLNNFKVRVRAFRRVTIEGEVKSPGVSYADPTMTLREVIGFAGGLTDAAHRDRIAIVRGGERIAIGSWATGSSTVVELQSGDQVIVGRRSWLSLNVLPVVTAVGVLAGVVATAVASLSGGGTATP